MAYLTPEMLQSKGLGEAVDWYLLGVLLYEMLFGILPIFHIKENNFFKILNVES